MSGEKSRLSRRDFLKMAALGLGGVALAATGIEIGKNPHFINAFKVIKELTEAEISRDPERKTESRKLAMVWLFAETAAKYSREMGLGGAGLTMEHYLYGNGSPLDISFLLEKVIEVEPEEFVSKLISSAINNTEDNIGRNISTKQDYQFTNKALKELKGITGLQTALDAKAWLGRWEELYNAFGGARYTLHSPEADIVSQEGYGQRVVLEKGINIEAFDRYYWQLDFPVGLDSKSSEVMKYVSETLFDRFYKSHDFVEKTIKDFNLSDAQVNTIMAIYSSENKDQLVSNLASGTYDFVDKANQSLIGKPDLVENDLNLLKKLGAKEYDMKGHVNIPNRIEIFV